MTLRLLEKYVAPEYDLRLSRYFRTSPGFWLRLQLASDSQPSFSNLRNHSAFGQQSHPSEVGWFSGGAGGNPFWIALHTRRCSHVECDDREAAALRPTRSHRSNSQGL
jgi:hypothetical protein